MEDGLVAEILRATGNMRAGDLAGATARIQEALALHGLPLAAGAAPPRPRPGRLRRPLGEVVRTLTAGRRSLDLERGMPGIRLPAAVPDLPLPEGAAFRELSYSGAAGARRYRLYVPASAGDGLEGLVVMLHGCTQGPEDFAAGTGMNGLAERHRLLVAYPAQTVGENSMSCWNWFRPGDQLRGSASRRSWPA